MLNECHRTDFSPTEHSTPIQPILVTVTTACRLLSLGRTTIYQLIANGALAKHKCGKRTLITMASIRHFVVQTGAAPDHVGNQEGGR